MPGAEDKAARLAAEAAYATAKGGAPRQRVVLGDITNTVVPSPPWQPPLAESRLPGELDMTDAGLACSGWLAQRRQWHSGVARIPTGTAS
ncbi:hypothetical protein HYH02_001157 [Chlamydomonas schloesseri]|uniref:Uncharacterized protein n=1 Tax=Chlamydomonas schloesseri TaxID=2026947 RepID=A0A835WUY8_9CHLO|nr:hypothetical protein HYH02_001157 [Chlamydomonas schloesseri]|eukprot:KAG2454121.1 hypothetical protein HYH02_001157 [Chlamydomonas schloesseri]